MAKIKNFTGLRITNRTFMMKIIKVICKEVMVNCEHCKMFKHCDNLNTTEYLSIGFKKRKK